MKRDVLLEAARALREESAGASADAGQTRARVLASLRRRRPLRLVLIKAALPVAAVLAGSIAWAAAAGRLPASFRALVPGLHVEDRTPPSLVPGPATAGPSSESVTTGETPNPPPRPVTMGETPKPSDQPVAMSETPKPSDQPVAMGETLKPSDRPATMGETVNPSDKPATMGENRKPAAQPGAPAAPPAPEAPHLEAAPSAAASSHPADRAPRTAAQPLSASHPAASATPGVDRPAPAEPDDLALYEAAHRLHFVSHDTGAALAAWDAYLRGAPRGRFSLEARYNRALCLVRLGRAVEARQALEGFARGAHGGYRQAEARALLDAMGPASP